MGEGSFACDSFTPHGGWREADASVPPDGDLLLALLLPVLRGLDPVLDVLDKLLQTLGLFCVNFSDRSNKSDGHGDEEDSSDHDGGCIGGQVARPLLLLEKPRLSQM